MPNRTEVTWQKPSRISTGRLPLLRLFSTLLALALIERILRAAACFHYFPCNQTLPIMQLNN